MDIPENLHISSNSAFIHSIFMHSVVDEEENIVDQRFHFGVSVTQRKELITPALHAYHHCHKDKMQHR